MILSRSLCRGLHRVHPRGVHRGRDTVQVAVEETRVDVQRHGRRGVSDMRVIQLLGRLAVVGG